MLAVWLSLALAIAAVAAALTFAIARAIGLYRQAKRVGRAFSERLEEISRTAALAEGHVAKAQASGEHLHEAGARLRAAQARLGVQLAAVREARGQVRRLLWFVPGI